MFEYNNLNQLKNRNSYTRINGNIINKSLKGFQFLIKDAKIWFPKSKIARIVNPEMYFVRSWVLEKYKIKID